MKGLGLTLIESGLVMVLAMGWVREKVLKARIVKGTGFGVGFGLRILALFCWVGPGYQKFRVWMMEIARCPVRH